MDDYLEILKVEAALKSENMKMQYRKVSKPDDINILDYTVIAALEKQNSKQVLGDGMRVSFSYYCPNCREELSDDGYKHDDYKYCPECGQKLNWDNIDNKTLIANNL